MTRGFALLTVMLDLCSGYEEQDHDDIALHFERLFVASQVSKSEDAGLMDVPFAGKRKARVLLNSSNMYPLTTPILRHQLSAGIWGTYRRSASYFGLIQSTTQRRSSPSSAKLTTAGAELAKLCRHGIVMQATRLNSHIQKPEVDKAVFDKFLADGWRATPDELSHLGALVRSVDSNRGRRLGRLRDVYDLGSGLTPDTVANSGDLEVLQQAAATGALDLLVLMRRIEQPYRQWVTGRADATIPTGLGDLDEWRVAETFHEHDLLHLRGALRANPTFDAVHQHHTWLASRRGSTAWVAGYHDVARSNYHDPDFALPALTNLFNEGILHVA